MLKEALLYEELNGLNVRCYLCNHYCKIGDSEFGFCGVRENREGKLFTHAYGEAVAVNIDPVEKKPLYHFLPGTRTYSIAAQGCNFHCGFCQNWQISQVPIQKSPGLSKMKLSPGDIVGNAIKQSCRSISYTYTEPTIFFEYALDTARLAKENNLYNIMVTNGYMTLDALRVIAPYIDASNVDLKSFNDDFYSETCQGHLKPVLNSIREMKNLGIWVEITTLIIPDQNDSEKELTDIARFIAELDINIPWHISRFHPDYQFVNNKSTPLKTLNIAYNIGKKAGLLYIYKGNVLGDIIETLCSKCGEPLIRRNGFFIDFNSIQDSSCPSCGEYVAGVF
jgi:pyruvate formate lyase activating enzyme